MATPLPRQEPQSASPGSPPGIPQDASVGATIVAEGAVRGQAEVHEMECENHQPVATRRSASVQWGTAAVLFAT